MTTVACDKCKARLGLPDAPSAPAGAKPATKCGYCGGPLSAESAPVQEEAPDSAAPTQRGTIEPAAPTKRTGALDELWAVAEEPKPAGTEKKAVPPPKPAKKLPVPPPRPEPTQAPMVELLSVRGRDSNSGGRQIPLESGVALNGIEPAIVLQATHEPEPSAGVNRESNPMALQAVSALPSVSSRPPRGLVQSLVKLPPFGKANPRDSLDDGWDSSPSAAPPPVARVARVAPAPAPEAAALPRVGLPREILAEDALAAPSSPPGSESEWAGVPDDALISESLGAPRVDELSEDLASAPSAPRVESLHDAVGFEPSQVSGVLDNAAVQAAIPPAWQPKPFAVLGPEPRSGGPQGGLRRLGPWILGGRAVVGVAGAAVAGFSEKKTAEAPPAAPAGEPLVPAPAPERAPAPPSTQKPAPARPTAQVAARETRESGAAKEESAGATSAFNSKAAHASLARAMTKAKACKKPKDAPNSAVAIVTFATNGYVVAANVSGKKLSGTPLAACVTKAMRSAQVPAFKGEPVTMKKTVPLK